MFQNRLLVLLLLIIAFQTENVLAQDVYVGAGEVRVGRDIQVGPNGVRVGGIIVDSTPEVLSPATNGVTSPKGSRSYVNASLQKVSFEGQNLSGVSFANAELNGVSFRNADLRGADFTNVTFHACDLQGALVMGANFTNVTFTSTRIGGVDFSTANLTNADMSGADYSMNAPVSARNIQAALVDPKSARINLAILFDFDKDTLTAEGWKQLTELGNALKASALSGATFRIEGHTDSKGSDEYNIDLSYRRALRVMNTVSDQFGIDSSLLEVKGYGESMPLSTNDNEFGRAQNRRVTIVNTSLSAK
ncbi:MAG: pentapeptide repeat-containing protein [Rickettsiales bacterium]|nr:pentapeptide repeat-containing protein [Rickettsiales bacterium]